ncbi:MAG: hypothetical protein ACI87O_001608 [Planctomycetota bacterium]|jgi:hypothetical protein
MAPMRDICDAHFLAYPPLKVDGKNVQAESQ